jgi:hypothetical protein
MPEVSVVMSVYNGAAALPATIESILKQEDVDLEFVIVNDGSSDESGQILEKYEKSDPRVRIISQKNLGLTKALIRGCWEARAPLIARQDVGDRSLPGRLRSQIEQLESDRNMVLVSCGTRFLTPEGDWLYDVIQSEEELVNGLRAKTVSDLRGPSHHGCVMFRRDQYEKAGGYRPQLSMAQDMDLWLRLAELGRITTQMEVYYQAEIGLTGISAGRAHKQRELGAVILEAAQFRRKGASEAEHLDKLDKMSRAARETKGRTSDAAVFIGACLMPHNPKRALAYFRRAIVEDPLNRTVWRSLIGALFRKFVISARTA